MRLDFLEKIAYLIAQMSILFSALQKAARDYRSLKAPIVVPLLSTRKTPSLRARVYYAMIVTGLLFCAVGVSFYISPPTIVRAPAHQQTDLRAVGQENGSAGIILTAGSEDVEAEPVVKNARPSSAILKSSVKDNLYDGADAVFYRVVVSKSDQSEIEATEQGVAQNAKNRSLLLNEVAALERSGKDNDLEKLDALAERYPDEAAIHAARAHILARQNDYTESLRAWEEASKLSPDNKAYRLGLAIINDKLGRELIAYKHYTNIPQPLPDNVERRIEYLSSHHQLSSVGDRGFSNDE